MGNPPKVAYPTPTAEETALQQAQLAQIKRGAGLEEAWQPILEQQMGYRSSIDPTTGKTALTKLSDEEYYASLSPQDKLSYDVNKAASERELQAYRGELPVDPATERELTQNEQALREQLARNLGPGYETSTAGIEGMATERGRAAETRSAVRRGDISNSEAVSSSRTAGMQAKQSQQIQDALTQSSAPLGIASAYSQPISWYGQNRAGQFQRSLANQQATLRMRESQSQAGQSGMGASCCFNFLEAEGDIAESVRNMRDKFFSQDDDVAKGYRIMASTAVPLMRENPQIKRLVRQYMTQPFIKFSEWYEGKNDDGFIFEPTVRMWVEAWRKLGQEGGKEYTWDEFTANS